MGKFGWSYPAGCDGVPGDEDCWCQCCGREAGQCICPECPVCGENGNPKCYENPGHGLGFTPEDANQLHPGDRKLAELDPYDRTGIDE